MLVLQKNVYIICLCVLTFVLRYFNNQQVHVLAREQAIGSTKPNTGPIKREKNNNGDSYLALQATVSVYFTNGCLKRPALGRPLAMFYYAKTSAPIEIQTTDLLHIVMPV